MLASQIPPVLHWLILLSVFGLLGGASTGLGFLFLNAKRHR
jgi:hypothetical protein